ncbi:MAG TPA: hypothetical protein VGQ52_13835 [Gemmatimonadaceae bacterium]|jgi:hypothetical protein|nr:hypothetical protein [Gemmatimonadaceae bacterium]
MTRDEIMNLQVGDAIERDLIGTGNWTQTKVTQIFGRGVSAQGLAYVCMYTDLGEGAEMSGSATEGDGRYFRLPPAQAAA